MVFLCNQIRISDAIKVNKKELLITDRRRGLAEMLPKDKILLQIRNCPFYSVECNVKQYLNFRTNSYNDHLSAPVRLFIFFVIPQVIRRFSYSGILVLRSTSGLTMNAALKLFDSPMASTL